MTRDTLLQNIGKLRKHALLGSVGLRVRRDGVECAMRIERKSLELERQLGPIIAAGTS